MNNEWDIVAKYELNAYFEGVREGVRRFAHWKDGEQYVGTCGTTLTQALAEVDELEQKEVARRAQLSKI